MLATYIYTLSVSVRVEGADVLVAVLVVVAMVAAWSHDCGGTNMRGIWGLVALSLQLR